MENQKVVLEQDQKTPTGLMLSTKAEQMLNGIEKMQVLMSLSISYFKFTTVGESASGIFMGFAVFEKNTPDGLKPLEVAVWCSADRQLYANGGSTIMSSLATKNDEGDIVPKIPQGTPIRIEYKGEEKASVGNVKIYLVEVLKPE